MKKNCRPKNIFDGIILDKINDTCVEGHTVIHAALYRILYTMKHLLIPNITVVQTQKSHFLAHVSNTHGTFVHALRKNQGYFSRTFCYRIPYAKDPLRRLRHKKKRKQ